MTFNETFYSVYFKDGADTYATKYISKKNYVNFSNKVTVPSDPSKEGYTFADCDKGYEDAEGTRLIAALGTWGNIAALGHDYGEEWKSDEESHWHECSRGDVRADANMHTEDGGIVTKQATETEAGIRTWYCQLCHRELRTETIPAIENSNPGDDETTENGDDETSESEDEKEEISKDIERGDNALNTNIFMPAKDLADIVLTDAER